jgi:hypothetical protein
MIVSVRNWTSIALPKRAKQAIQKIAHPGPQKQRQKQVGLLEAWEHALCTQANLLIQPYDKD